MSGNTRRWWMLLAAAVMTAAALSACGGPLGNSEWRLVSLADSNATVTGNLSFDLLGRVGGFGPCNLFGGGSYTTEGSGIVIDVAGTTLIDCLDESIMAAENAFFAALETARTYRVDAPGVLTLGDGEGHAIAWFERSG